MSNGKKFSVKKKAGVQTEGIYPVESCSTRWRSAKTGRIVKTPQSAKPSKPGRAVVRKGGTDAMIVTRRVVEGETVGARVMLGGARKEQRRGKMKLKEVRELEKDLSRDALETFNPGLSAALHSERMHEAHNSSKARRGAATRKKNATTRKKADPVQLQTKLLRAEQLVKDAEQRHRVAKTPAQREKWKATLSTRGAKLSKARTDYQKATK